MNKLLTLAGTLLLGSALSFGQFTIGTPTQSPSTATTTVSVGGTGTGTVTGPVINCPSTCTETDALNTTVILTETATGGSTFIGWSGACGGTAPTCAILVLGNNSVSANFSSSGGGGSGLPPWPTFVIDPNQANSFPGTTPITTGGLRSWDSGLTQFVSNQVALCVAPFPCTSAFNFNVNSNNSLDKLLTVAKAAGVTHGIYPLSRTPQLVTSHTGASSCTEQTPTGNTGQCYPPIHLNADGSGSNQEGIDWFAAVASHVHGVGFSTTHAVPDAWETKNEPDTGCSGFYCGTYDQAVRDEEDLYFLIKGDSTFTFTSIGTNTTQAVYTGTFPLCTNNYCAGMRVNVTGMGNTGNNQTGKIVCSSTGSTLKLGTAATLVGGAQGAIVTNACTAVSTVNSDSGGTLRFVETFQDDSGVYRTAAQVRAAPNSVATLAGPISTTDLVFMGSFHGGTASYTRVNIWLYCNGGSASPSDPTLTACAHPSNAGSIFSDIMNWHFKPGCAGTSMEAQLDTWTSQVQALLSSVDLAKPFWDTEGGFGTWAPCPTGPAGQPQDYTDPLMKASYVGRFHIYSILKEGESSIVWYNDSNSHGEIGSTQANSALDNVYDWLQGGILGSACTTLSPGTAGTGDFIYQCAYTDVSGNADVLVWDTSQSCTNPTCTTTSQAVSGFTGGPYTHYDTLVDNVSHTISAGHVPVGITPIRLRP